MKLTNWLISATLVALPAAGAPINYTMSFTGGITINNNGTTLPLAPDSGSFTYDSASGFSNFLLQYQGETFDATASANSAGTPASVFSLLTEDSTWTSSEISSNGAVLSDVVLSNKIVATAGLFAGFSLGDLSRAGAFVITPGSGTPIPEPPTVPPPTEPPPTVPPPTTPPPAETPEPATVSLVLTAGLAVIGLKRLRRRTVDR